ncbi:MAG: FGGY-family carbohydrate kinase [Clostridiales bacterium]|nr:FGGY-family carbohydrate kinase [Clostridiales bacterium]
MTAKEIIESGKAVLGIEFGSTRIKAVLTDNKNTPIAQGAHDWENSLDNGIWTYSLDDIWDGLRDCYAKMADEVKALYGVPVKRLAAMGFSAMMHGYMVFDENDRLLVPFRTWRNTITEQASVELTELFDFPIPQRWSIAHLYQAMLSGEEHIGRIKFQTTLAGYIHWQLSGEKVLGIGEASGMFPIDSTTKDYNEKMVSQFDAAAAGLGYSLKLRDIFPHVLTAGESAGMLTKKGAALLDPTGDLEAGVPMCPPEGDAGTGMAATDSVTVRTGNVSAGTSVFAMIVLEKPLSRAYSEIDLVTTPAGEPVAMVHCNNCTSDINAWVGMLKDFTEAAGLDIPMSKLYEIFFTEAAKGSPDCGRMLSYNYFSGEPITGLEEGRPLFVRTPDSEFSFENFARLQLYSALASLKIGLDILFEKENVPLDSIMGHGGFFKTPEVGQQIMADAINAPVSVMSTAGEGGAWGIALLASYMINKATDETLDAFLKNRVFAQSTGSTLEPTPEGTAGFLSFLDEYKKGLEIEKSAAKCMK